MRPQYIQMSSLSDDADGISTLQDFSGASDVLINGALASGGVATLAQAQIVGVTSAGNDSGLTFTIYGTYNGQSISEAITGSNAGVAVTTLYFDTVTRVTTSGATGSTGITVGTDSADGAVTDMVVADWRQRPFNVGMGVTIDGTMTCTVQHTFDDIYTVNPADLVWHNTDGLTAITATDEGNFAFPCRAARLQITAYTSGSAELAYIQASC